MFPFWEIAIAPVIEAVKAQRLVEIGALRGDTTVRLLDGMGPRSEVHVIDPLPQFDPAEHEQAFPGRYIFHRDISHNVLPTLPPVDVALIDGDHNWYTVYHELRMLAETAKAAGRPLPVMILHDVLWPYGRRDLYYEPSRIPEEWRQPYAQRGLHPELRKLVPEGGMNADLDNALEPGGPRNGVMTALQDFLAERDKNVRLVLLPFYFGLAIVVERDRLAELPALAEVLDHLESRKGRFELLELSERIRISAAVFEQNCFRLTSDELARRAEAYLEMLKAAILDEHYLDNEMRIDYLARLAPGAEPDAAALRDPSRHLPIRYSRLKRARTAGQTIDDGRNVALFPFSDMGRAQIDHLHEALTEVVDPGVPGRQVPPGVPGDLAECGVGRGGGAVFMCGFLHIHDVPDRRVWLIDDFRATDPSAGSNGDVADVLAAQRADINLVRDGLDRFGLLDDRARFVQGDLDAALADAPIGPLALLRVGRRQGHELRTVLDRLLPLVSVGGRVIVEGTADPSIHKTVDAARDALGITSPLENVGWNAVSWVVSEPEAPAAKPSRWRRGSSEPAPRRVAIAPPVPDDAIPLSIVVVLFNMRREAARTLLSLSRSYQTAMDDLDYEVIVVDNGSSGDQRLTEEEVVAFGPEFRYMALGEGAPPTPTVALNRGIAAARGEAIALMIDGAHVLTPGVLHLGMKALDSYAPAVVAVQQWYLGPGQQGDAQQLGYDQDAEDKLFTHISWPTDGYQLFQIGHFIGDRDWFDGIVESNCLFVPRALLEQVGGYDDSFSMAGGGYANLDLFERLGSHPGVNVVSLLGEGSFHQTHGGTTTNISDAEHRRGLVFSYGQHFVDLRGRPLDGLRDPIHYIGSMATKAARRTRSRREMALSFDVNRDPVSFDPTSAEPSFVADELKIGAIEAVWDSQTWKDTRWLGHPVARFPTDLQVYQELISAGRPDWVVLIGDDPGLAGRALYVASILDGLGHGRVVAVGALGDEERVGHDRVTHLVGAGESEEVAGEVARLVDGGSALVIMGLGANSRVIQAFERYAPLVPVGLHLVVENTVVNGRPVVSGFGPGPHEGVVDILRRHRDFVPDPTMERYTLTFNRGGYLKRMSPP